MRVWLTVVDPTTRQWADVVMDADPATPVHDVATALAGTVRTTTTDATGEAVTDDTGGPPVLSLRRRHLRQATEPAAPALAPALFVSGRRVEPGGTLAGSGLRDGCVVSLDNASGCLPTEPDGLVEVRVVSGVGAGVVHRLPLGEATIGSDPNCVVPLADDASPRVALTLTVAGGGAVTAHPSPDLVETAGLRLDGEAVTERFTWRATQSVRVGDVLLELDVPTSADAALEPGDDGALDYNRPPRLLPPLRTTTFKLPTRPEEPQRRGIPLVAALAPLAMGIVLVIAFGRWYFLLFGIFTPIALLGNWLYDRRYVRKEYRRLLAQWRERTDRVEADAAEALVAERLARRAEAPDPAAVLLTAVGPRARLWERRRDDPDHLVVRVGTGTVPSEVTLEDPEQLDHRRTVIRQAVDVPATVSLRESGVMGVAGRGDRPRQIAAWVVGQLAVLQSPRDVVVYVLTQPAVVERWDWVRWLPHCRPTLGQDCTALIGADTETLGRRVGELTELLAARHAARRDHRAMAGKDPDIVVVLDGARRLRALPGVIQLLKEGPQVGIHLVCLDSDERLLPEECSAVVTESTTGLHLRRQRESDIADVRPDRVADGWAARVSRALAPVRDVSDTDDDATLPGACRLLDVLGLEPPTADAVAARWMVAGRTTQAVVGVSLDGAFALDISRDGPHALVAGTTGSGKSELLQTVVASLAAANRPDAMTFVLVDYKGGAAFKDCVALPHTVGMVTDLDAHLVERALVSLGAELRRREHLLADVGATDIEGYLRLRSRGRPAGDDPGPLPRLVIVIDEFASLARELPEFVSGLVSIAQRGRSLGIHLVLATQRPSGVVSPEIRANTNLRIALRVTDPAESSDVLDAPDAARISKSTPGRAFVRLGASSLVPFQSARVGGRRPGRVSTAPAAPWASRVASRELGAPPPRPPAALAGPDDDDETDLAVLVEAIGQAAHTLAIPAPHRPWLAPLSERLLLDDLLAPGTLALGDVSAVPDPPTAGGEPPELVYGLADHPDDQRQRPAGFRLGHAGHLYVIGGARSGRSQVLRTLAGAVAMTTSSVDVHLYGIDCGNGALRAMEALPHCGAVVQRTQAERTRRLVARLTSEMARRREVLAAGGYSGISEQRAGEDPADRLPYLLVLIDRWEGFTAEFGEEDHGSVLDRVAALLREGASVGLHLVVTGDRSLLSTRWGVLVDDKLVLRLPDRADYSLAGLRPRNVPEAMPPGRGVRAESGIEVQVALLDADPEGRAQAAALEHLGDLATRRDAEVPRAGRPFRVDVLPAQLTFDRAWEMRDDVPPGGLWALVGVGGDDLVAVGPDLAGQSPTFIVAGPPRSGRSTVLSAMVSSYLAQGTEVVVAAPRPSPLRDLDGQSGVVAVLTGDLTQSQLEPLLTGGAAVPRVFVVDDAELLRDCEAKDWLRAWLRRLPGSGQGLVIGGNAAELGSGLTGWQVDARRNRCGALLSPQQIIDGDLVGVRLPRSAVGGPVRPGRALVHLGDAALVTVQIPTAPQVTNHGGGVHRLA